MHRVVLGARRRLQVFRILPLQPFDERHAEPRRQARILAIRFLSAAPARIAKQIHIRAPERQALINIMIPIPLGFVIFCATFGRNHIRDAPDQLCVKARRQPDRLRKNRCQPCARHAVQRLVPPVIARQPRLFVLRRSVQHLLHAFLRRHLVHHFPRAPGNFLFAPFISKRHRSLLFCRFVFARGTLLSGERRVPLALSPKESRLGHGTPPRARPALCGADAQSGSLRKGDPGGKPFLFLKGRVFPLVTHLPF